MGSIDSPPTKEFDCQGLRQRRMRGARAETGTRDSASFGRVWKPFPPPFTSVNQVKMRSETPALFPTQGVSQQARDSRNLIHTGREQRIGAKCDRPTATSARGGVSRDSRLK